MDIKAVIFDLDGVIVSTDELHYQAWRSMADRLGIPFNRTDNERLRGVSRMESLEIILEKWTGAPFPESEKLALAESKNDRYRDSLTKLGKHDILPGVEETLADLRARGVRIAIGSSSRNAMSILRAIGLMDRFDAIADGTHITRSKPDPEVFLLAADLLGVGRGQCLVVEDADAGVEAALRAGMEVLALGPARHHPLATHRAEDLLSADLAGILGSRVPLAD